MPARVPGRAPGRVIVIAGPSGSGKTRLCRRIGLPVLNLDHFYKDGDDPSLPFVEIAGGAPIVDWDSLGSWNAADALAVIERLCATGRADVPSYDIGRSRRTGHHSLDLAGSPYFVAEGIFAQEVVAACRQRALLGDAICLSQHPVVTFLRRLARDLREHRKPPVVLLRRGVHLWRDQRRVVAHAEALGCRVLHPEAAYAQITGLVRPSDRTP